MAHSVKYDRDQFLQFLQEKIQSMTCPLCHQDQWTISENIYELREYRGKNGYLLDGKIPVPIVPLIPMTCDNCGNTILINAILAGVLDKNAIW